MKRKIKELYGTGYRSKDKGIHMGFYYPHPHGGEPNPSILEELYIEYKEIKNPKFDTIGEQVDSVKIYPRLIERLKNYWKMNQNEVKGKGWASLKEMAKYSYDKRILAWLERLVEYFKNEIEEKHKKSIQ